jgi:hypothetical protein
LVFVGASVFLGPSQLKTWLSAETLQDGSMGSDSIKKCQKIKFRLSLTTIALQNISGLFHAIKLRESGGLKRDNYAGASSASRQIAPGPARIVVWSKNTSVLIFQHLNI